jgi:Rrf2 family protein
MLRFTKEVDYGLIAMQYIAAHQGDAAVSVKRIADAFGIPAELLAKVLQRLAKGKLMVAQSGPRGGYRLTLPPSAVTVGQIVRALDGAAGDRELPDRPRPLSPDVPLHAREPVRKLQAAITGLLDTMTLAELSGDDMPATRAAQSRNDDPGPRQTRGAEGV